MSSTNFRIRINFVILENSLRVNIVVMKSLFFGVFIIGLCLMPSSTVLAVEAPTDFNVEIVNDTKLKFSWAYSGDVSNLYFQIQQYKGVWPDGTDRWDTLYTPFPSHNPLIVSFALHEYAGETLRFRIQSAISGSSETGDPSAEMSVIIPSDVTSISQPDITISEFKTTPKKVFANQNFTLHICVKNIGTGPTDRIFSGSIDSQYGTTSQNGYNSNQLLNPDQELCWDEFTIGDFREGNPWVFDQPGPQELTLTIDGKDNEIVTSNNSKTITIDVQPETSVKPGVLIKNEKFVEVFYLDRENKLRWITNEESALKHFGSTWNHNIVSIEDLNILGLDFGKHIDQNTVGAFVRPGDLVKENGSSSVFFVDDDLSLRWVTSEQAAVDHFGSHWNQKVKVFNDLGLDLPGIIGEELR